MAATNSDAARELRPQVVSQAFSVKSVVVAEVPHWWPWIDASACE